MLTITIYFILGIAFLLFGADILVRGSVRVSEALGIPPLIMGLTVVAFGTGSPELAISLKAQVVGSSEIALGNIIGSNICNILLILGVTALLTTVTISIQVVRRDVPFFVFISFAPLVLGYNGIISRIDGLFLVCLYLLYTYWLVRESRQTEDVIQVPKKHFKQKSTNFRKYFLIWNIWLIMFGLLSLFIGSQWVVDSAVSFARILGISKLVIGLTIISFSTSLPEIATSVVAALRGRIEIAVGNVVGSNIFNILIVLGIASTVSSHGIHVTQQALWVDIPVMISTSIICLPIFLTGRMIDRFEGGLLLFYYGIYMVYLFLRTSGNAYLPEYIAITLGFVIPLTFLILSISFWRFLKQKLRLHPKRNE